MNNSTNITNEGLQPTHEAERIFKIVFYVFCFIIGTIGNLLVVIIVKGKNRHRTVNDYFIFNLAIADLTFLCFALPFYYYELFERFPKFEFYCKFVWPMMSITLLVSINTLTLMAVERCRAVVFPFRPRVKKPTLFTGILSVWLLSVLIMVPLMIVAEPIEVYCKENWSSETHRKIYTVILFVLQFALPITVIAVAYITIVVTLVKTKVPGRTKVNQRGQLVKQKTRADNLHIIRTVAIIVVLFVICMLPNQIAWILVDFGGEQYKHLSEKFWLLAEALMFFHSCVNPIIYGSLTRQFREGYIQYLRYLCCCFKRYIPKGVELADQHHINTRSRIGGRIAYQGSLKSPSSVANGMKTCQVPTIISSCRYGIAATPPTSARSTPASTKRLTSSPSRASSVKPQPPSPLVIDNKMIFLETTVKTSIKENKNPIESINRLSMSSGENLRIDKETQRKTWDVPCRKKQHVLSKKKSSNKNTYMKEDKSTILPNQAAFERDQKHENHCNENINGKLDVHYAVRPDSNSTSVKETFDENVPKNSRKVNGRIGISEVDLNIENDEPAVQDTYL